MQEASPNSARISEFLHLTSRIRIETGHEDSKEGPMTFGSSLSKLEGSFCRTTAKPGPAAAAHEGPCELGHIGNAHRAPFMMQLQPQKESMSAGPTRSIHRSTYMALLFMSFGGISLGT